LPRWSAQWLQEARLTPSKAAAEPKRLLEPEPEVAPVTAAEAA
jgi:hypothetical protein